MKWKRRKTRVRHRSPIPPPSRLMERAGYRRTAEKERVRDQVKEES
jgi:hypothetical protein